MSKSRVKSRESRARIPALDSRLYALVSFAAAADSAAGDVAAACGVGAEGDFKFR